MSGGETGIFVSGARVVTPGKDLGVVSVRIAEGRIAAVGADAQLSDGNRTIEADGLTLLPGFVDIHSHGRGGCDFCNATDEAFDTIGRGKLADGVTGFLATGLTRPEEDLVAMCHAAERYKRRTGNGERGTGNGCGATCLGVHLEGPFFNAEMAGAQNPAYLKKPDAAFVKRLDAISSVKKVSLAPELEGAEACIRELAAAGIVTSGGHSAADYETFERARKAGMTHLTHFCNAMMPIHHLRPTMVTGGLLAGDMPGEARNTLVRLRADDMLADGAGPCRLEVDGVQVRSYPRLGAHQPQSARLRLLPRLPADASRREGPEELRLRTYRLPSEAHSRGDGDRSLLPPRDVDRALRVEGAFQLADT